jgi:hypothetical protein
MDLRHLTFNRLVFETLTFSHLLALDPHHFPFCLLFSSGTMDHSPCRGLHTIPYTCCDLNNISFLCSPYPFKHNLPLSSFLFQKKKRSQESSIMCLLVSLLFLSYHRMGKHLKVARETVHLK